MTALVDLPKQMRVTPCSVRAALCMDIPGAHCAKNSRAADNAAIVVPCFGFCNRKKIKHPVILDLAVFQIYCTFTLKNQKGKFFGVAQEDMINNTSGL